VGVPAARRAEDRPLSAALDGFFDHYYRARPVNATFTGVHAHDHRLPDWSPEGLDAATAEMRALRPRLAQEAGAAEGRDVDAVDAALADAFLEIQIAEHDGPHFQRGNPALFTGEAIFSVIALMTRDFAPAEERLHAAAARLRAIPSFLAAARRTVAGPQAPVEWTARALRECGAAALLLGDGVERWLAAEPAPASLAAAVRAGAGEARAAFGGFASWLRRDAAPAPDARYACGPDFLDLLIRRGHRCERPRAELLAEAHGRLDEALARLHEQARAAAPGGWPEVQARLAELHPSADDYLPSFERVWRACRALAEERDLVTWPEYPIRYVPIPEWTRAAAPSLYYLFYRSPAPFDHIPVHDYVVPPISAAMPAAEQQRLLRATNASVIKLNHVVHHGALGHHVQNCHAYRAPSRVGRVAAVDGASRIGMFCGGSLAEGWACYATDLMAEAGFLTDLEAVAEQHTRARLLARAVVDVELHQGTMTLDEAAAFYGDRIGMSPDAARGEAVKNSMFPGTAMMYWLGTQGIHDLRARRQATDGPAFSLRAFHDELLGYGALPVPLIARLMSRERTRLAAD